MEDLSFDEIIEKLKPPLSIQLYNPPKEVLFHGYGNKLQRNIYKNQVYTDREIEKIRRLNALIKKEKLVIPKDWDDSEILKFIYGSDFKTNSAFKAIKSCLKSRSEVFPEDHRLIYPKILEILKTGPLYFHGRDCNYRPLLIMNFSKFDLKKYSFEQYLQSACFVLEFTANYLLYPGKVENWMCISDLGFKGLGDLPLNTLRKITKVLQDVFKSRLAYSAMINVPRTVLFIYACLKPFLDKVTIDKISIAENNVATNIISHFNPYQVEERYGGKAPDLQVFWPPCMPDCPVEVDGGPCFIINKEASFQEELRDQNEGSSLNKSFVSENITEILEINSEEERAKNEKKKRKKERRKRKRKAERKKKKEQAEGLEANCNLEEAESVREYKSLEFRVRDEEDVQSLSAKSEGFHELVVENTAKNTYCGFTSGLDCSIQ